jgi:phosphoglycerol transferase MdoB-like AlkP superfamily enzyme
LYLFRDRYSLAENLGNYTCLMELRNLKLLFKRIFLILIIFTLCRLIFYIFNFQQFQQASIGNILLAFIYGWRFDLAIVCVTNVLFILLSVLPFRFVDRKKYQKFLKILFVAVNIHLIILNLIDVELFRFRGQRSAYNIIGMGGDLKDQWFQVTVSNWYLVVIATLFIFLLIKFYPKWYSSPSKHLRPLFSVVIILVILGSTILGMRGGFQLKPLRPNHAFVLYPSVLGNITLNTPFAFFMTMDTKGIPKVNYFKSTKETYDIIDTTSTYHFTESRKDNVIIIILESFGAEYWGAGNNYPGYTPFLDSLSTKGLFIKNHFANGKTSIDAVPAILAGIPALMEEPYINSIYQTNKINGLGTILKKYGYNTSFFHSARNGSMGFDVFVKNAGFEKYYGLNEYPDKKDFDGNWGIPDERFLHFFCREISTYPQPFLSSVFTISSHQPYTIPEKYIGKFPKGKIDIHETIGYTDYSLREFFNAAKKEKWYSNTLFIITGDHTQENYEQDYKNIIGNFNVPLLIFHPGMSFPAADSLKITQHTDIMPTVLDYLNIRGEQRTLFGRSAFGKTDGIALTYSNNSYRLMHSDYFVEFISGRGSKMYNFKNDKFQKSPIIDKPEILDKYDKEIKAFIQYFNNGINENNWYNWVNPQ